MEKVYDHVHWDFLISMMRQMGFRNNWCNWIQMCISSVSFSIMLNGSSKGFYGPTEGCGKVMLMHMNVYGHNM